QCACGSRPAQRTSDLHLGGQIAGHHVDAFRQILPNTADVTNLGLTAELTFGADLACDPGDFRSETAQLIDHGVDRVFELENLAAHVDSNFLRQIAVVYCYRHLRDVSPLCPYTPLYRADAFRQILPNAADVTNCGLTAELTFGADLACDPGDFRSETAQLIDHGVDRVFELENLPL